MIDIPAYDPDHWQADALCFRMRVDPDVMQPERATREEVAEAMTICGGCPVVEQCRQHARDQERQHVDGQTGAYGIHAGEWWGPDPVWVVDRVCGPCGAVSRAQERYAAGPWFCSRGCRTKAAVPA